MDTVVHGSLAEEGLEVVLRGGRYFVRYDAGTHAVQWREDEISPQELERLRLGGEDEYRVIIELQKRLEAVGENPYQQNWGPARK